jgi:hypothetical protein
LIPVTNALAYNSIEVLYDRKKLHDSGPSCDNFH